MSDSESQLSDISSDISNYSDDMSDTEISESYKTDSDASTDDSDMYRYSNSDKESDTNSESNEESNTSDWSNSDGNLNKESHSKSNQNDESGKKSNKIYNTRGCNTRGYSVKKCNIKRNQKKIATPDKKTNIRKSTRIQNLKKKSVRNNGGKKNIKTGNKIDNGKIDTALSSKILRKNKSCERNKIKNLKRKKEHNQAEKYDDMIDSMVNTLVVDTMDKLSSKRQKIRDEKWKNGLSVKEVKKLNPEYLKITKKIYSEPSIQKILKVDIPFKTKCSLIEKQIIFENTKPETFEYLRLKNHINLELDKYRNIDSENYDKYDTLENKISITNNIPLKYKILKSGMEFDNLSYVYNKYLQYDNIDDMSENSKLLNQINTYVKIPTKCTKILSHVSDSYETVNKFLQTVKNKLDDEIYGLNEVKEQIIIQLNNTIVNPASNNMNLALIGPQGVGKTALANALAKSINLAFVQINLGGCTDSSFLVGHSYTYEGSRPGIIVDSLIKMKSKNGIIFFDEIDKISKTKTGDEISKSLLHIIDNTQNFQFKDKYLGDFKIDLSKIWFIFSLNYENELDKTLKDRLNIIRINGYNKKEKVYYCVKLSIT